MSDVTEFTPMVIDRSENKKTRDIITSTEWNELFNLLITQGDHNSNYLEALKEYLFTGEDAAFVLLQTQVARLFELSDTHETTIDTKLDIDTAATTYETLTDASQHLVGVTIDETTGVFTFIRNNGQALTIDTGLEKVATNWEFDETTQTLVLTLADGSKQYVDLSAFIKPNEFADSASIVWSVSGNVVSAAVSPAYLTQMTTMKTAAETAQSLAQTAATTAGGYRDQAAASAIAAQTSATNAATAAEKAEKAAGDLSIATTEKAGIIKPDGDSIKIDEDGTIHGSTAAAVEAMKNAEYEALPATKNEDSVLRVITDINGKETLCLAKAYNDAKTYAVGDYCIHSGLLYKCIIAITIGEAFNETHWKFVTVMDEVAAKATTLQGNITQNSENIAELNSKLTDNYYTKTQVENLAFGSPDYANAKDVGLPYTPTANGYLLISSLNIYTIKIDDIIVAGNNYVNGSAAERRMIPISKGDTATLNSGSIASCYFIPFKS